MKKNLRYKAYREIKDKILHFELKPGQKIIESDLSKTLKMSRTPVREALLMIESESLVECVGKSGFYVRKPSQQNISQYYQLRIVIENFAAPAIIENITLSDIKALKTNISQSEKAIKQKDMKNLIRLETQFHQILYKSSRSEVLIETLVPLIDKFHWLRSISLHAPRGAEDSIELHVRIHEAIKNKDVEEYKKQMGFHLNDAEEKYKQMQSLFF
jgi:DNA-binding GntR family transcriptional regulator